MSWIKLAIACDGDSVSPHFGRCEKYVLVLIKDGEIVEKREILNPGHRPGFLPGFLKAQGVNVVIAGGIGAKARELLQHYGISCILGVTGIVDEVIDSYLKGTLSPGQSQCQHEG